MQIIINIARLFHISMPMIGYQLMMIIDIYLNSIVVLAGIWDTFKWSRMRLSVSLLLAYHAGCIYVHASKYV